MIACLSLITSCGGIGKGVDWEKVDPNTILHAIELFEKSPFEANSKGHVNIIMNFATKRSDVMIMVNPNYFFPWIDGANNGIIVFSGFFAGNTRAQLIKKETKDHPLEGFKFMLAVYTKLRAKRQIKDIPIFNSWCELDDKGLEQLINELNKNVKNLNT